jgi:hypothetical protein
MPEANARQRASLIDQSPLTSVASNIMPMTTMVTNPAMTESKHPAANTFAGICRWAGGAQRAARLLI